MCSHYYFVTDSKTNESLLWQKRTYVKGLKGSINWLPVTTYKYVMPSIFWMSYSPAFCNVRDRRRARWGTERDDGRGRHIKKISKHIQTVCTEPYPWKFIALMPFIYFVLVVAKDFNRSVSFGFVNLFGYDASIRSMLNLCFICRKNYPDIGLKPVVFELENSLSSNYIVRYLIAKPQVISTRNGVRTNVSRLLACNFVVWRSKLHAKRCIFWVSKFWYLERLSERA